MPGYFRSANGIDFPNWSEVRNWRYGAYCQDDWKVSPRLTLNIGLRYELSTVVRDRWGRLRSLEPSDPTQFYPPPGTSAPLYDGNHKEFRAALRIRVATVRDENRSARRSRDLL